jgi:hypothetical protein
VCQAYHHIVLIASYFDVPIVGVIRMLLLVMVIMIRMVLVLMMATMRAMTTMAVCASHRKSSRSAIGLLLP